MTAFIDTSVLVRHLTGDPAELAARATALLYTSEPLLLSDVVVAETVRTLEFYEAPRVAIAIAIRSLVAFDAVVCVDLPLLLRAIEVYETTGATFTEAYLVASAESTGIERIVSFADTVDAAQTVDRIEPP